MPILILLFIWFLAEIVAFIYIGGMLGIGETVVEVIATIIIGSWIIKRTARSAMTMGLAGLMGGSGIISNVIGGVLLVIPGFLTDILGVLALLSFPFNVILLILGFGRKPNLQSFINARMGGMAGGMGGNPFGGANPFGGNANKSNPFENATQQGENPFAGNPVFEEMVKKQQARQNGTTSQSHNKGDVIEGEVIKKD